MAEFSIFWIKVKVLKIKNDYPGCLTSGSGGVLGQLGGLLRLTEQLPLAAASEPNISHLHCCRKVFRRRTA